MINKLANAWPAARTNAGCSRNRIRVYMTPSAPDNDPIMMRSWPIQPWSWLASRPLALLASKLGEKVDEGIAAYEGHEVHVTI